jgi:hypothetical protein
MEFFDTTRELPALSGRERKLVGLLPQPGGPTYEFASMVAKAATKYDIGVRIIEQDRWKSFNHVKNAQ